VTLHLSFSKSDGLRRGNQERQADQVVGTGEGDVKIPTAVEATRPGRDGRAHGHDDGWGRRRERDHCAHDKVSSELRQAVDGGRASEEEEA
jgi:hypothetical protein